MLNIKMHSVFNSKQGKCRLQGDKQSTYSLHELFMNYMRSKGKRRRKKNKEETGEGHGTGYKHEWVIRVDVHDPL